MKTHRHNPAILIFVMSLTILSCSTGQLLGPTKTATATIPPTATITPRATMTPVPTKTMAPTSTPAPAILTDGSDSWPISTVTMENSAPIGDQDVSAEEGMAYLKIVFSNPEHKLLPFPTLPGSTETDYSTVSIRNAQGEKYIVVSDRLDLTFGLDGSITLGDISLYFQSMPEGSKNFQLFFANLDPIDLGDSGTKAVSGGKDQGGSKTIAPTAVPVVSGNSFVEDFSSNIKGWDTGDESTERGTVKRAIVDGKYNISMTGKQDYYYVLTSIPVFSGDNFTLTVDATVLDSTVTPGNMSLEISMRQMDGLSGRQNNFILMDDGASWLDLWPNDNSQDVVSLWSQTAPNSSFELKKGVKRTISIVMNGPNISATVNGNKIASVTDTTVTGAGGTSLGICLYKAGETVSLALDNLKIQEMP
jgi:hypothetical protein